MKGRKCRPGSFRWTPRRGLPCPSLGMARKIGHPRVAKGPKPRSALSAASTPVRGALREDSNTAIGHRTQPPSPLGQVGTLGADFGKQGNTPTQ
jgi:hypothetical protein